MVSIKILNRKWRIKFIKKVVAKGKHDSQQSKWNSTCGFKFQLIC